MDGYDDKHHGSVSRNGHTFDAVIVGPIDRLRSILNSDMVVEYELNEFISAEPDLTTGSHCSGIIPQPDGSIAIYGEIQNETRIDDQFSLLDIHIGNSTDLLTVTTEELGFRPSVKSKIKIVGRGLHIFPTFV